MDSNISSPFPKFPFELPMILDGACGTRLIEHGMPSGICAENWICEHSDIMASIQKSYVSSGSDALYTPTFGANFATLSRYNCEQKIEYINKALCELTKTAGAKYIGGDVSPTGRLIYPSGDSTLDEICEIYAEQARHLENYVDFYISETNISLAEAKAAVLGIKSVSQKPVFVTFTVNENGKTLFGDELLCCLLTLFDIGISAFGINCSFGAEKMLDIIKPLVPYSHSLGIPLIAKPNAMCGGEKASPEDFGKIANELLKSGIYILGGCCGTDEKHIAAIKRAAQSFQYAPSIKKIDAAHLICSSKSVFDISAENCIDFTSLDDDFSDNIEDKPYVALNLKSEEDFNTFYENLPFITAPLVLSGEKSLVKRAKRIFVGKILVL